MNSQDVISAEQGSKPSKQVASDNGGRRKKPEKSHNSEKVFRITTTIEVLHERYYYVAARSVAEARRKHKDGLSAQDPYEGDFEHELFLADTESDGTDDEPVEITDPEDLEDARQLIAELVGPTA